MSDWGPAGRSGPFLKKTKMKKLAIILFLLTTTQSQAHDFKLARFDIKKEQGKSLLVVRLDRENLLEAMKPDCANFNELGNCFEAYLRKHFAIEINDEKVKFMHLSHEFESDMIELTFALDHSLEDVQSIGVYNDALIEKYSEQENILGIHLNGRMRSFRMNKDRIRTIAKY